MSSMTEELLLNTNSVSPSLFVGLGGSGSKIVDRIAEKLSCRWDYEQYRRLVHFFAVDTNQADLEQTEHVPPRHRILISDFDKRAYVEQKRGGAHLPPDAFTTQWLPPEYAFRSARGSGAGQVRIESRLSLAYQLERDRGEIIRRINEAIYEAKDHDNPFRRSSPRRFNAFVFGSVAGGTGSGGFLVAAYLLQELIEAAGWIPQVYATLLLPSLFHRVVKGALQPDIDANGYAALKELEHLMRLGYEGQAQTARFHYNPNREEEPNVRRMPFGFVYVVDLPAAMSIASYSEAVADSAYVQLFSPVLGAQEGEYDNYEKHQKTLANGYAVHYGSFGCSVLVLPDDDLLEYCSLRYAKKAMEGYLTFRLPDQAGEAARELAVNWEDPKFRAMSEERRAALVDQKYVEFVRYLGRLEQDAGNPDGPFSTIVHRCERREKKSDALAPAFDLEVERMLREAKDAIDLHTITPVDITAKNIKVDAEVEELRRKLASSRSAVASLREAHAKAIESGALFRSFFEASRVDPFCQRYFLVGLGEHLAKRLTDLATRRAELVRYELDSDLVRDELTKRKALLARTAEYTLLERLKRRNEDFEEARAAFVRFFNDELSQVNRMLIEIDFQREIFTAMQRVTGALLEVFRSVTARAAELIAGLGREADRLLATAQTSTGRAEAHEYVLDVEALQDFSGRRYWDRYFDEFVGSGEAELALFNRDAIFSVMNAAFAPGVDEKGRRTTPTADEVAEELRAAFVRMGREKLEPSIRGVRAGGVDRKLKGLLLDDALRLEARYSLGDQLKKDHSPYAPTEAMIEDYLVKKLRFCADKSGLLATIDETLLSDEGVVAASDVFLVGLHDHYQGAGTASLEPLLRKAAGDPRLLEGWHDEKQIVFYRAMLGVPLYFYRRVNGEMRTAYRRVLSRPGRKYPLHIDANWEEGLPDLDPRSRKADDEVRGRESAAAAFLWALLAGGVERRGSDLVWVFGDHSGSLGRSYREALATFAALDERTRARLDGAGEERRRSLRAEPDALARELGGKSKELDDLVWDLEQRGGAAEEIAAVNRVLAAIRSEL
jgi:hypothetical protein